MVKGIDGQVSKVKNGGAGSSGKDKEAGSKKGGGSKGGLGGLFNKK